MFAYVIKVLQGLWNHGGFPEQGTRALRKPARASAANRIRERARAGAGLFMDVPRRPEAVLFEVVAVLTNVGGGFADCGPSRARRGRDSCESRASAAFEPNAGD